MQVWLIPSAQELEVDTFEQERNICLRITFWLTALWWGTRATCWCVEPSLSSDFKHRPWDVQRFLVGKSRFRRVRRWCCLQRGPRGSRKKIVPVVQQLQTSSAFSGDIARRPARTQLWSMTLPFHGGKKKNVENPMLFWIWRWIKLHRPILTVVLNCLGVDLEILATCP